MSKFSKIKIPHNICLDFDNSHFYIISGNSRCGKTVLLKHLVTQACETRPDFRFWDKIILLCPTYHLQPAYKSFIPPEWALTKFKIDEVIADLLQSQEDLPDELRGRVLLILDDIIGCTKSKLLEKLATSGRHYRVDSIILCQYLKNFLTPTMRSNSSYIICAKIHDSSREVIVENIPRHILPTTTLARQWVDKTLSEKYNFIVLSNDPEVEELSTMKVDLRTFNPITFQLE